MKKNPQTQKNEVISKYLNCDKTQQLKLWEKAKHLNVPIYYKREMRNGTEKNIMCISNLLIFLK